MPLPRRLSRPFWLLALAAIVAAPAVASAEPFWARLVTAQRVDADPDGDYRMTRENGPWMIMATTFSGEGAEGQARELVVEMRKRYKLEAYLHEMTFDFSDGVEGRGIDATGRRQRMKYQRASTIREIAVLVGNYPSVDDPEAQRTLRRLKYMRPAALNREDRQSTSQSLAALRTIQAAILPDGDERKKKGPMGKAFVSRNPLLPKEYFVPNGVDPEVVEWNRKVKHSLLECRGKYTVQVATFTGTVVLDQRKVQDHLSGRTPMKSKLEEAAYKAHRLTIALRSKGYEAYQFHDRYASLVTIGSFDATGTPRADGKTEINPRIHAILKGFAAESKTVGAQQTGFIPKVIDGIALDLQPQIVHVPKASLSSRFSR